jgi:RND superfamily putative drug exporter
VITRSARAIVGHPWIVVAVWVAVIAASLVFLFPTLGKVPQTGLGLPSGTDSVRAQNLLQKDFPHVSVPDTVAVVLVDNGGLKPRDLTIADQAATWFRQQSFASSVAPPVPSKDGKALLVEVTLGKNQDGAPNGVTIENHLTGLDLPSGVQVTAIGNPIVNHDLASSTGGSIGSASGSSGAGLINPTRLVSLVLVLIVLALVYRSPLAVITPLVTIAGALLVALGVSGWAGLHLSLPFSSFTETFMFAAMLGAGTNYGLFLISRYREELGSGLAPKEALELALSRVAEAILCSGFTVVVSMALMLVASFGFIRALSPIAIGVGVMLIAGLTLLPALMRIMGPALLWPTRPKAGSAQGATRGVWRHVGNAVTGHPVIIGGVVLIVLLPLAFVGFTSGISFDSLASFPQSSMTLRGDDALTTHFAAKGTSVYLVVQGRADDAQVRQAVLGTKGVASISASRQSGDVTAWQVSLDGGPESAQAVNEVTAVENAARGAAPQATVLSSGDATNTRDTENVLDHDLLLVIVLIGATVLVILGLLLRSVVQPLYLVATTALSTAAAIGIVALIYRALDVPLFWTVPIFALVFLVSLGQDFNILLVSRIKHEVEEHGRREGIARAVGATGGVISSCGLVMVVSFAVILHLQFYLIQQIGAAVVVGLLLDTFIVRPILVPALSTLLWKRPRGDAERAIA